MTHVHFGKITENGENRVFLYLVRYIVHFAGVVDIANTERFKSNIAGFTPDARVTSANPKQPRVNKGSPLYGFTPDARVTSEATREHIHHFYHLQIGYHSTRLVYH
jgi:hypothetical protein